MIKWDSGIKGDIHGVTVRHLKKYMDSRGWLAELFRSDEVDNEFLPEMAYISTTLPGVARGPHEHRSQADLFCFIGPGNFKLYLWDNRTSSPTSGMKQVITGGEDNPIQVIIPPGVVHAYRNMSDLPGVVFNAPNRLYAGRERKEDVDEIRYEDAADSPFNLD